MRFFDRREGFFVIALIAVAVIAAVLASGLALGRDNTAAASGVPQAAPAQSSAPAAQGPTTGAQDMGTGVGDGNKMHGMAVSQDTAMTPGPGVKNSGEGVGMVPDVSFTLKTNVGEKGLSFVGVGGNIDGQLNPKLEVAEGAIVQITLINGDGAMHDVGLSGFPGRHRTDSR